MKEKCNNYSTKIATSKADFRNNLTHSGIRSRWPHI